MITLDNTTRTAEVILGSPKTTNDCPFTLSYTDNSVTTFVPGSQNGTSNGTTAVTVMSSPATSVERQMRYFSFFNSDTVSTQVYVRYNDNGTTRVIFSALLGINYCLTYNLDSGWTVSDPNGAIQYAGYSGVSGFSGTSGAVGTSGYSGASGTSGVSGFSGYTGTAGVSGYSGVSGINGASGFSGYTGSSGTSGVNGTSGYSGISGYTGTSGTSGANGLSGYSGVSGTFGVAGSQIYWPTDVPSDVTGYDVLNTVPESTTEQTFSAVANNNTVLIASFATPSGGIGQTIVPAGAWEFNFWAASSSVASQCNLSISVYSRTSGGAETLLFTSVSPNFVATGQTQYNWESVQPEFSTNLTDRLVMKVKAVTLIPLNTTISFYYGGTTHYSYMISTYTPVGVSGYSGSSGTSGATGTSGFSGYSGVSGFSGPSSVWQNWTPSFSGFSGTPTPTLARYTQFGKTTVIALGVSGVGLSGYSGFRFTLPNTANETNNMIAFWAGVDNTLNTDGIITTNAGSTWADVFKSLTIPGNNTWVADGYPGRACYFTATYENA